jgi:predicted deacetylase
VSAPLLVSVHDVAPGTSAQTLRWLADLDRRGVPATLLLVPGPWRGPCLSTDGPLADAVLAAEDRGHELALHGYYHVVTHGAGPLLRRGVAQVVARGGAEFATLSQDEARARIEAGLDELGSIGVAPVGFHPPGLLVSPETVHALRRSGLRYYATHLGVNTLRDVRGAGAGAGAGAAAAKAGGGAVAELRLNAPALAHRAGSALAEQLGMRLMTQAARRFAAEGRAFRIALHPDDLARPGLRDVALRAIDDAIAAGAHPTTYAAALGLPRTARRREPAPSA